MPLVDAIDRGEAWVDRALCRLVGRTATTVGPVARDILEDLATYRDRWNVSGEHPAGRVPRNPRQVVEFNRLATTLKDAWSGPDLPAFAEVGIDASQEFGRDRPVVETSQRADVDMGVEL